MQNARVYIEVDQSGVRAVHGTTEDTRFISTIAPAVKKLGAAIPKLIMTTKQPAPR